MPVTVGLLALVVRLAWVVFYGADQEVAGDQIYYHVGANALARGDGFVNPYAWGDPETRLSIPSAQHPPAYQVYLAAFSVLGFDDHVEHRLVSTLLGVGTTVVCATTARRLAGRTAGWGAGLIAALYPNLWVNDGLLAAESIYALFVASYLLACWEYQRRPRTALACAVGTTVGLAALARAEGAFLLFAGAWPLILLHGRRRLRHLLSCSAAAAVVVAPWVVRNLVTFDPPVLLSTGLGFVLETANCDATYQGRFLGYWAASCQRDDTWPVQPELTPGMDPVEVEAAKQKARVLSARRESEVELLKRRAGVEYMREHIHRLPIVMAARIGRMWDLYRPFQGVEFNDFFERRGRLSSLAGLFCWWLLAPLSLYGALAVRRRGMTLVPVVSVALSVTITAAMAFGITRYRIAADTTAVVLAGVAVGSLVGESRRKRSVENASLRGCNT